VDVARIDELKASEDSSDDEMLRENQSHDSSERGRRRPRFCAIAQLYRKDEYVPAFSHIEIADGRIWLLRDGIDCFAGDLTDEEKELTWATAMACARRHPRSSRCGPGVGSRRGVARRHQAIWRWEAQ
jgi:hypothetical protein